MRKLNRVTLAQISYCLDVKENTVSKINNRYKRRQLSFQIKIQKIEPADKKLNFEILSFINYLV